MYKLEILAIYAGGADIVTEARKLGGFVVRNVETVDLALVLANGWVLESGPDWMGEFTPGPLGDLQDLPHWAVPTVLVSR